MGKVIITTGKAADENGEFTTGVNAPAVGIMIGATIDTDGNHKSEVFPGLLS